MASRNQPLLAPDSFFPEATVRIITSTSAVNPKMVKNQLFFNIFFAHIGGDLRLL